MPPIGVTYSFKDLTGVINHPLLDNPLQIAGGNIGIGEITIRMITQRTEHEVAADGVVMPSYVPGANAEVTIAMQQTSALHHAFLALYNSIITSGDATANWAAMSISLRTIVDGAIHRLQGASFQKIPDKPYAAKGQNVSWVLMAAFAVNQ